ncbi:unnamed protein product [Caenorhabditis auriculariae]|uniref:Uncharacterized protein n=1 Tax=Caenorhabditis auriculariae TaxID=2777116 RepID=A0A8S1HDN8_9PELO|nr:unnamed protein product [Caenorhabditis auriculariae]
MAFSFVSSVLFEDYSAMFLRLVMIISFLTWSHAQMTSFQGNTETPDLTADLLSDNGTSSYQDYEEAGNLKQYVAYTTAQKTIFIACAGGTFVLLLALAFLTGLSDTILKTKQKTRRTHA